MACSYLEFERLVILSLTDIYVWNADVVDEAEGEGMIPGDRSSFTSTCQMIHLILSPDIFTMYQRHLIKHIIIFFFSCDWEKPIPKIEVHITNV